jgi:PAS domain S-box-containing protein
MLGYRYTLLRENAWNAERRQTESALRVSEQEQRFLVDHLLAGVVVHDADGLVLRSNPQACSLFGLSLDQMMGKAVVDPTWRFVREDGSAMPVAEYPVPLVISTRTAVRGMTLGVMQPGVSEPVWLQGDAYPEFDEQQHLRRVIVTFVDISMRRRIEQTLVRSESRYRMLYENSLDGVLQTRPDGTILRANPAACRIFGMSEALLCSTGRDGLADRNDPRVGRLLAQRELEGQARGEITMRRGDGSEFEAEVSSVLYADTTGQHVTSIVVRDVTDRRRAEAALTAKDLAERANHAKSEFMARMSHELRTPLNAILGFTEVLVLDSGHPLQPVQHERLRHIQQAGDHLLQLINDLLDLSRIESGAIRMELEDVDATGLAQAVLVEVAEPARAGGVELLLDLPAAPLRPVRCDRTRLRQVLLNLVSNGIKYNAVGGRVTVTLADPGERFELTVRDTGLGMTTEQIEMLFEPFNRLGREGTAVEGTGIGLVITRSLVELMGGRIVVSSQPGHGTTFVVSLPLAEDGGPAATAQPLGSLSHAPARGRVLYIDDDPVNRVLMQAFLGLRPGVQLSVAGDGASGLAMAEQQTPDLMLVDMMMPTMNGLQVLQAIRASATLQATPCMAVSANAMPHEIAEALAAGFDGYLTKPLSAAVLLGELDRVLG